MLRSLAFHVAFYLVTALFMIAGLPLFALPRRWCIAVWKVHGRAVLMLLRVLGGVRSEIRGLHHVPHGACLIASKHQSAWDTIAPGPFLQDCALVLKQELLAIPLYGWYARKMEMIPIRRDAAMAALRAMVREARARVVQGRQIIIFPEGTRRMPGAPPAYKPGVIRLYEALDVPCVPVAVNSGLFWPRRAWRLHPGTVVMEFLEPIPPGLSRNEFRGRLEAAIETATARLVDEALAGANPPPAHLLFRHTEASAAGR